MAQTSLNSTGVASSGALSLQSNGTTEAIGISTSQVATFAKDAVVQGLTVGRGAGAVSTNTAVGASALAANTTGAYNTVVGALALDVNTTGNYNQAFGYAALGANTTGEFNSVIGMNAMVVNTTGSKNIAVGHDALGSNTTASNNTAVGYQSLYSNSTGALNTATGVGSLYANTTGVRNSAAGGYALSSNTSGGYNVAHGYEALAYNTTASYNTAVGYQAGYSQTTTGYGTFLGQTAGYSTTGISNTFVGQQAGALITSGAKNTIIGRYDGNQGGLDIRTASNYIVLSDGDGNPRGIFDGSGNFLVNTTSTSRATNGTKIIAGGSDDASIIVTNARSSGGSPIEINRQVSDGVLIAFYQAETLEGNISVSGTTVSYNGGHLARYAQTVGAKDESLVKGTVLSNLDEMNVYTDAEGNPVDNEQLNKIKVSDVEGDANVAGVFVNWSHDEQHNVDEINMAMTGDMIIRIAQGTIVQRGDLLMSAGDGTAKPQSDDIVRSKTVAKVTSNHVTCTYADGSYCVPCVLMAC
jgi:hypothetical protein